MAWLEEKTDAAAAQAAVVDLTSLLVSQAHHLSEHIRTVDSDLDSAHAMHVRARESVLRIEKRLEVDRKLVAQAGLLGGLRALPWADPAKLQGNVMVGCTLAGVEFVNGAKRPFHELEQKEAEADAAEAYHSDDDTASDSARDELQLNDGGANGGQGGVRGKDNCVQGASMERKVKPKPKKAKQREAAPGQ